jgi:hypothetical protein
MTEPADQDFVAVTMGRREWRVPVPMTFLALERAQEGLAELRAAAKADTLTIVGGTLKVIAAALSISKSPPALQELKAILLPAEFVPLLEAFAGIMRRSGFEQSIPGEAAASSTSAG